MSSVGAAYQNPMYVDFKLRENQFRNFVCIGVSGEVIFNSISVNRKTPLGHKLIPHTCYLIPLTTQASSRS
ncbi:MAG TPA: hypothetical protein VIJ95_12340 [Hanamia sp.]